MAAELQAERHITARNTILFWLGALIAVACIAVLVTYHMLREDPVGHGITAAPIMSKRDSTMPARVKLPVKPKPTAESAQVAAAHRSAVAAASGQQSQEAKPPQGQ